MSGEIKEFKKWKKIFEVKFPLSDDSNHFSNYIFIMMPENVPQQSIYSFVSF